MEKSGDKLIGVLLYIICHFPLLLSIFYAFDFHHSNYHVSWCVLPWVYTAGDSLYFLTWLTVFFPILGKFSAVQFSSVAQLYPTLCDPMDCSMPGFPVHYQLPEFAQTHVHQVGDAIQPSHPLLSPSPPAFNLSQHQGLFQ